MTQEYELLKKDFRLILIENKRMRQEVRVLTLFLRCFSRSLCSSFDTDIGCRTEIAQ